MPPCEPAARSSVAVARFPVPVTLTTSPVISVTTCEVVAVFGSGLVCPASPPAAGSAGESTRATSAAVRIRTREREDTEAPFGRFCRGGRRRATFHVSAAPRGAAGLRHGGYPPNLGTKELAWR